MDSSFVGNGPRRLSDFPKHSPRSNVEATVGRKNHASSLADGMVSRVGYNLRVVSKFELPGNGKRLPNTGHLVYEVEGHVASAVPARGIS